MTHLIVDKRSKIVFLQTGFMSGVFVENFDYSEYATLQVGHIVLWGLQNNIKQIFSTLTWGCCDGDQTLNTVLTQYIHLPCYICVFLSNLEKSKSPQHFISYLHLKELLRAVRLLV